MMFPTLEALVTSGIIFCIIAGFLAFRSRQGGRQWFPKPPHFGKLGQVIKQHPKVDPLSLDHAEQESEMDPDEVTMSELATNKRLYHQLHNLEQHPDVLASARDKLISLFAQALSVSHNDPPKDSILSMNSYTRDSLMSFVKEHDDRVNRQWEAYIERRKHNGPRELFRDRDEAKWWLKQIAPSKYVDGAWLGYINKTTLPFRLRPSVKHVWQVLSEELGDGDLNKNHANLFRELIKGIAPELPPAYAIDFIHDRHGMDAPAVWRSALAQLLISLFPHEFFPEILGFNMHFEAIAMETLIASKELQEVNVDSYYFMLHVSIDNADSGHTAIAQQAVCEYLDQIYATQGASAAHQAWRRVQVGYTLSERSPGTATCPSMKKTAVESFPRNKLEADVIEIFEAKAFVAHKIHKNSNIKIGGKLLVDWLNPETLSSKQTQMEFMECFSETKPWIYKGNSSKSRFVKELLWGGRMFGAFTESETDTVKSWIDAMADILPQVYWDFTGRLDDLTSELDSRIDLSSEIANTQRFKAADPSNSPVLSSPAPPGVSLALMLDGRTKPDFTTFLPLWFAHPCLLEPFVSIPFKTTTTFASAVVKILRAQSGFELDGSGVAGSDESNRSSQNSVGLVELGQEMMRNWGLPEAESLKEILATWDCEFAITMLQLSLRQCTHKGFLIGMSMAFTNLHAEMASSILLCRGSQDILTLISRREQENLAICVKTLDPEQYKDCCRGYWLAANSLQKCFSTR